MKDSERKGLLWILDEESMFPGATEDSFMDRFFTHHGEQKVRRKIRFIIETYYGLYVESNTFMHLHNNGYEVRMPMEVNVLKAKITSIYLCKHSLGVYRNHLVCLSTFLDKDNYICQRV